MSHTYVDTVQIRDDALWFAHFSDQGLAVMLLNSVPAGAEIAVMVGGFKGYFQRMENGTDGRTTPGLKPIGKMKSLWHHLYKNKKGERIEIMFTFLNKK